MKVFKYFNLMLSVFMAFGLVTLISPEAFEASAQFIPGQSIHHGVVCGGELSIRQITRRIAYWVLLFFTSVAVITMIYGGYKKITARKTESEEDKKMGNKIIIYSTLSIPFLILGYFIVYKLTSTGYN